MNEKPQLPNEIEELFKEVYNILSDAEDTVQSLNRQIDKYYVHITKHPINVSYKSLDDLNNHINNVEAFLRGVEKESSKREGEMGKQEIEK